MQSSKHVHDDVLWLKENDHFFRDLSNCVVCPSISLCNIRKLIYTAIRNKKYHLRCNLQIIQYITCFCLFMSYYIRCCLNANATTRHRRSNDVES